MGTTKLRDVKKDHSSKWPKVSLLHIFENNNCSDFFVPPPPLALQLFISEHKPFFHLDIVVVITECNSYRKTM